MPRLQALGGEHDSPDVARDVLFPFKEDSCNQRLATYEIAYAFREILNKEPKEESRVRRKSRRPGDQKCCVVVSDEITGWQIRGPLTTVNLSPRCACKNALCRQHGRDETPPMRRSNQRTGRCSLDARKEKGILLNFGRWVIESVRQMVDWLMEGRFANS